MVPTFAPSSPRVTLYARVSTADQEPGNQLHELRQYAAARGWTVVAERIDHGISGAKDRRPGLDQLVADARRRRFDILLCWRLDRLGRSLAHLVKLTEEFEALGVKLVTLSEGIDCTTPAGTLVFHVLASLAQFERARIAERVRAGLARARREGKHIGRPKARVSGRAMAQVEGLSVREAARVLGVPASRVFRERGRLLQNHPRLTPASTPINPSISADLVTSQ